MSEYDNEEISFFEVMGDEVKPLAQDKIIAHDAKRLLADKQRVAARFEEKQKLTVPLSMNAVIPIEPEGYLAYKQAGIQDGVYKNLRLGKYAIDNQINLSGLTLTDSALSIYNGILQSHKKGDRALVIKHGKGLDSKPFPGLKKSYVNHWLRQMREVIAFHTAQPMHGGLGSTYVLLKKHPDQKLINREKNRRR
ncbi:DNA endonuclease SmrA [Alteromonas sp. 5E99-2]|uniref:DNA endonuclease SmrA n=1 Tax=Alteromonas sp. 5E99-2 TaxID=2817683 RepID=UPI001A99A8D4|nr:DNA endonuclease SmrA [Alteromonas sp. 5E99-2]MBO1254082.1 DNA endonuclease SmrA [Alteromonas sp. 5E99-2]